MATVLADDDPAFARLKEQPNHVLGLTYAKENARFEQAMGIYPIERKKSKPSFRRINRKNRKRYGNPSSSF